MITNIINPFFGNNEIIGLEVTGTGVPEAILDTYTYDDELNGTHSYVDDTTGTVYTYWDDGNWLIGEDTSQPITGADVYYSAVAPLVDGVPPSQPNENLTWITQTLGVLPKPVLFPYWPGGDPVYEYTGPGYYTVLEIKYESPAFQNCKAAEDSRSTYCTYTDSDISGCHRGESGNWDFTIIFKSDRSDTPCP